jgi:exopolyphosphatase/guanosine-5'-triphosphate,3'-diphosphate pyrophosphatase
LEELVAAVDLGSNSFHMIIGRWLDGEFRTLERVKQRVQLAGGLDARSELTERSRARALACLRQFGQRLQGVSRVRAVGTSALREARNRDAFLVPAAEILGCPIDVISGEEEGRLIYLGVARVLEDESESRLVVDIGGGSTELVLGRRGQPERVASVPVGCVSVTRRFLHEPAHLGHAYAAAQARVQARIEAVRNEWGKAQWQHVAGSSGTIESVQEMLRLNGWTTDIITRDGVERLHSYLLGCRTMLDASLSGLPPDRVDIFPGGFAILAGVFRALDLQSMEYVDGTLLDGVLHELLERPDATGGQPDSGTRRALDMRAQTIASMQRRYQVDIAQAARVAALGERLRQAVEPAWGLGDAWSRQLLCWAADVHEVGLAISPINHPRHGAYLIDHGEMRGFNTPQRRAIALLVRSQRRAFLRAAFSTYAPRERQRMTRLAFLLRLAIVLCGARTDASIPELGLRADHDDVVLSLPTAWLQGHALSSELLEEERTRLRAHGVTLTIVGV